MILKTTGTSGTIESPMTLSPVITMTREEIEQKTGLGGGPEVVRLDVEGADGLWAVFWLSVKINKQGRPVAVLSTEPSEGKTVRKEVTGTCRLL